MAPPKQSRLDGDHEGGDGMMEERSTLVRLAPFSGAAFVALTLSGGLLGLSQVPWMSPGGDIVGHFERNTGMVRTGSILLMLAPAFLLWFIGSLGQRMRAAEATPARLSVIMFGGGVALAAAHIAGASLLMGASTRASEATLDPVYAELAFDGAGLLWSVGGAIALAVVLLAFAVLAARARTYATWWVWVTGVVGAALLIVPISWIVMFAGIAWILAMSIWLGLEGWRTAPPPA
jgi:hypothetical protein